MDSTVSYLTTESNNSNSNSCDLYGHRHVAKILLPLHYSFVFIIALLGNGLALSVILKNRGKTNSTTLYSTNLVISDLLFTTALPTRIVYYGMGFHWPFGEALCRITALLFYINTYASVNFMTFLSFDRFLAVVYPFRFTKLRKIQNVKYMCCLVWLIVLFQTLPLLVMPMSKNVGGGMITCMEYPNFEGTDNLPLILLGACFLGYGIPLVVILVCYSQVSFKLYNIAKHNPLTEKSGINRKAINVIVLVIIVFIICFSPYHIDIIQYMIKKLCYVPSCEEFQAFQISLHFTVCLMNFNGCMDPFIYFFACKGYKRRVMKMLKRQVSASLSSAVRTAPEESSPGVLETKLVGSPTSSVKN
ncbi:G-protein coupled receptor 183-like [Protopterus annectens]|uniref:G-protein coupled receptor 183-like n=1 Tax=Protopterus annectens TaxID=7888 RepID=UPI001CF9ED1D|nr:G-protein coupled receptor 183-like [Protopterus annectens]XP_043927074.1 G-protein coupled receptor 183-like [Protopterus annectens]